MDDLEKMENGLDKAESVPEENASASDELVKELEEIRDMFQEAIDNAAQEESGEIIQELDDVDHDYDGEDNTDSAEEEGPLCECCQEAPASKEYGEGYPYCENCRELMKHYPLRIGGVIAILAMVVIFGLSVYFGTPSLDKGLVVLEAQLAASQNKMMSTVQMLYSYASDENNDSKKVTELLIDGFIRTGYISNAKELIEKNYTEKELNSPINKKYKNLVDFVTVFLATREKAQGIVSDAFSGAEFKYKELAAELDKLGEGYYDEEKGIKYDPFLIKYYKYELLRLSDADLEKQLEILREIEALDVNGVADWIYVPSICEVAGKMGNKELAEECFNKMIEKNSEDMKAYTALALYYRYLDTPDGDAIIKLCEKAADNAYDGDTSYYPSMVIAYLIKGEGALAYETMTQYMSSNYYTVSNCNLYALCALYCGNEETYDDMVNTLKSSGYEMNELVVQYKNEKATLEDVLAEMRGDIG